MRICNISWTDYANFAYDNCMALRSIGIDCDSFVVRKHPFYYRSSKKIGISQIRNISSKYDIVQIFFSNEAIASRINRSKRMIVHHAGSDYRMNPDQKNRYFNHIVTDSVIALGEFHGLGAKNEFYVVGAVNCKKYKPKFKTRGKIRLGHFPSNPAVKGTNEILKIVNSLKKQYDFDFEYSTKRVSYREQIERMKQCDIYIELFKPILNNKPYGSWGITALEAAAMGKIVISNHTTKDFYTKQYGDCAIQEANTLGELRLKLEIFLGLSTKEIRVMQQYTRNWVESKHDYKPTATRISNLWTI